MASASIDEGASLSRYPEVITRKQLDVLAHPQRLRHFRHLQQRSPPQLGFLAGRRAAEYRRRPRVGFRQPQQDPHRRGFSRAIRSQ